MQAITTIGLDIAKSVFQVHGIDAEGKVVIRRQLKRCHVLAFFQKPWLTALLTRRPTKVAAIALANKNARMAWAIMAKGETLQGTSRASGLNEIAPGIRRDVMVGRANST